MSVARLDDDLLKLSYLLGPIEAQIDRYRKNIEEHESNLVLTGNSSERMFRDSNVQALIDITLKYVDCKARILDVQARREANRKGVL